LLANPIGRYTFAEFGLGDDLEMETLNVKDEARRLIEGLPDDATWDDLMHEIYVRQSIEAGLEDSRTGRVKSIEEVRNRFGLPQQ
jgi:hypothetical protein